MDMTLAGTPNQATVLLTVPFVKPDDFDHALLPQHPIRCQLWSESSLLNCIAHFSIAHHNSGICIHYTVCEPFLKARSRKLNDDVHLDNCIEFFINFNNEDGYYNFEFNCLGSIKGGYGNNRTDREPLSAELLKRIKDQVNISISNLHEDKFILWEITIVIPIEAFYEHKIQSLSGLTCSCNFTKCGDDLPVPHYLSWVNLHGESPNFHQPLCFGKVLFE